MRGLRRAAVALGVVVAFVVALNVTAAAAAVSPWLAFAVLPVGLFVVFAGGDRALAVVARM